MSERGRILVLDDQANWRELLERILRRAGYHVDSVSSFHDAIVRLQEDLYHIVVVDIRLEHTDDTNVEGMSLLRELDALGLSTALRFVVLSAFGTLEQMRTAFRDHRISDFMVKEHFDNSEFLETVDHIMKEQVRVNFDLHVHLDDDIIYPALANRLTLRGERVREGTPLADRAIQELDDLLRRLFNRADAIVMSSMASTGRGGSAVVRVRPFYPDMLGQPVVVKYGDPQDIDNEYQNYESYVKDAIGRATNIIALRRTPLLGGAVYSFVGAGIEPTQQFSIFYREATTADIKAVLDDLFRITCANWYRDRGRVRPVPLTEEYRSLLGMSDQKLEQALDDNYRSFLKRDRIQFREMPDRILSNPVYAIQRKRFRRNTYRCVTHGDLNAGNIMIDSEQHAWLIDFYRTGRGHILRDFIELEAEIKFALLKHSDLVARTVMEEALTQPSLFSELKDVRYEAPAPELEKAFAAVMKLRNLAQGVVQPSDDLSEYYIGLLYMTLNMIRWYRLPRTNQMHAFFAASLLCEKLNIQV